MQTLSNGIKVLILPTPTKDKFTLYLGTPFGSRYEPDSVLGIAHFTEHMLFTTNSKHTSQELIQKLEWNGISTNASTSFGAVKIFFNGPESNLKQAIEIMGDVVTCHKYTEPELEKERAIILEELKAYRNIPSEYLREYVLEPELLSDSSFKHSIIGTEQTINATTLEDIKKWKAQTYGKELVLCVLTSQDVMPWLETTFGSIDTSKDIEQIQKPQSTPANKQATRPGIDQGYVQRGFLAPSNQDEDYLAMLVLYYILDGGMSSRCFQELREKRGLGYVAGCRYIKEYGYGYFLLEGCNPEKTQEVFEAFDEIQQQLENISDDEFEGMKTLLKSHLLEKRNTDDDVANNAIDTLLYGSLYTYDYLLKLIPSVSKENVVALAKKTFAQPMVDVTLTPE